jgi:hypothetical protein
MKKKEFLKHRAAERRITNAYLALFRAVKNAPANTNITVKITTKGGRTTPDGVELEYIAVTPFIQTGESYDKIRRGKTTV